MCFEANLGYRVNLSKFEMVLVGNISNLLDLAPLLGCNVVAYLLMKYLDFNLGVFYKLVVIWDRVIETIDRRLAY